jgi:hypothetical protein
MRSKGEAPNFFARDLAGSILVLILALALVVVAFVTHAGPFILIALLIILIFGLLRYYRERGRELESQEVTKSLRTRLHKGEKLLTITVGDRRRVKPLATLVDFVLMMFSQGLAIEGSGALAVDDTFVGLTNRRLIAIDRKKSLPGEKRGWRERLNLQRHDGSKGRHAMVFEAPRDRLDLSVRLGVFYLARLNVRAADSRSISIGLNSRYWAERAVTLSGYGSKKLIDP